jgi:hypothetical protein
LFGEAAQGGQHLGLTRWDLDHLLAVLRALTCCATMQWCRRSAKVAAQAGRTRSNHRDRG